MIFEEDVILIAGPTASGKTRLAIELAQANDAVIINADSMQVYGDLRILTARPSAEEEADAPHHLFGHVDANVAYSVKRWLEDVRALIDGKLSSNRKLIFVGGTGLYFNALLEGLSPVPPIDEAIRNELRELARSREGAELHARLAECDPVMAEMLRPSDQQRIVRALEVFESTGRSLVDWQREKGGAFFADETRIRKVLLMPDRATLHERINARFEQMVSLGALEEVSGLVSRDLDAGLPAMKAIGVPQLTSYLRNEMSLDEAIEKAKAATRQYAKRQSTWFRNSFGEGWQSLEM